MKAETKSPAHRREERQGGPDVVPAGDLDGALRQHLGAEDFAELLTEELVIHEAKFKEKPRCVYLKFTTQGERVSFSGFLLTYPFVLPCFQDISNFFSG